MKLPVVICLLVAAALQAGAQTYITPVKSDLTPPTPQSARPVEYQMPQPALLTGAVSLSVPLYTITAGDCVLPLSMQYHSNGIKVLDDPCPYGYGWSLQPALRATRTILGRPDEHFEFGGKARPGMDQEWAYQCMVNQFSVSTEFPERYDSQHDIITFSLPHRNLTRILDCSSGTPVFISGVDDEYSVSADNKLDEITVTGPQGEKYIFGGPYEEQPSDVYLPGQLRTAWALKEIISTDGKSIKLTWTCYPHTYAHHDILGGVTLMDYFDVNDGPIAHLEHITDGHEEAAFTHIGDCYSFLTLVAIDFPGGKVSFSYDTHDRSPLLSKVEVSNSDRVVKTATLKYSIPFHGCVFLSDVTLSDEGTYSMEYDKQVDFQRYLNSQDWWGYYNGKDNRALTPAVYVRTWRVKGATGKPYSSVLGHADRSVDAEAMKANLLTGIVYPTGGRSRFEYEPHTFDPMRAEEGNDEIRPDCNPYLSEGGGLRVKSVEISAGDDSPSQKVTYSYCKATVREVPSMASFIDVVYGAFPLTAILDTPLYVDIVRCVNVNPISNYMRYDYGETPIWYETVTADYAEGRKVFKYRDFIFGNGIIKSYGKRMYGHIRKAFSQGPQLVAQETYKYESGYYVPVEKDSMEYTVYLGKCTDGFSIARNVIMLMSYGDFAPDLHEARKVPWCKSGYTYILPSEYDPYSMTISTIAPYTERLAKQTHTVYTDNGEFTTEQSFTYRRGTGLPESVTTMCSDGSSRTVKVDYPDAAAQGVQAQMVQAGAVGMPVRETDSRTGATAVHEADYTRTAAGAFRVARTSMAYDGSADRVLSPLCSYLAGGQLCSSTDADGLSSAWLWGYGGLYPVHRISGYTHAEVLAAEGSRAATLDAEGISLYDDDLYLATHYRWQPLVGVTSVSTMLLASTFYTYDTAGRLSGIYTGRGTTDRRPLQYFAYRTDHDMDNYVEVSDLIDLHGGVEHTVRTSYDGLGRPIATADLATGIASRTEYDRMGRAARTSVPGTDAPDACAWTVTSYEPSPRGVATATMRPGELWHTRQLQATARTLTNTATGDYACPRYTVGADGGVQPRGNYAAGTLLVQEATDEDGHTVRTFADMDGRTVMTAEGRGADMLRTRYVYDAHGRLRYVLPPAMDDGAYAASDLELAERAFAYVYDSRGRCISSRAPGCAPALVRYSRAGRVVAEHSPAMAAGEWTVHFYDRHGRDVLQAIAPLSETELSALCDSLPVARYDGSGAFGGYAFSRTPWSAAKAATLLHASYYDVYDFVDTSDEPDSLTVAALTLPVPGLLTGERDFMAGGISAYYYDDEGREVARRSVRSGYQSIHRSFDARGLLAEERETFTPFSGRTLHRTTAYTYDTAGRTLGTTVTENGVTASSALTYDSHGRVATETLGNGVRRSHTYDIHGWLTATKTQLSPKQTGVIGGGIRDSLRIPVQPSLPRLYYDNIAPASLSASSGEKLKFIFYDRLFYAEGSAEPRYTGCPTARVTTLGGRYDYRYDAHDRLTAADYTPGTSAATDEDFSTSYTYDAAANPLTVRRYGVVGTEADGTEEFGLVDDLTFAYEGNQVQAIANAPEGEDFYGRTGYGAAEGESAYAWNDQGYMTADSSRGITNIKYNHQGLPTRVEFGSLRFDTNAYDASGLLVKSTMARRGSQARSVRTYEADRVFVNGALQYSYFPGGYFDANGAPHYLHTDYQGSVVMVTDSAGTIEQHTSYYPYGEPHRAPSGQPILYGGKERLTTTDDYNYGARRHHAPAINWPTPDALADKFAAYSPYAFCFSNPIQFLEPDGNSPTLITGALGAAGGAILSSLMELTVQLLSDEKMNWSAVGGAAAQGAVVGGATGLTLGLGTAAVIGATAVGNAAGGTLNRTIQGQETTVEDVAADAALGAASAAAGSLVGVGVTKALDNSSNHVKGKIGEAITKYRYTAKGYETTAHPFKFPTNGETASGRPEFAKYDFLFTHKKTGKQIIRESKFNRSGKTTNQRKAWDMASKEYDIAIDRTTSKQIGEKIGNTFTISTNATLPTLNQTK